MYKKILNLSLPHVFSNITIPLLSSVDMALMGRSSTPAKLGAIVLGGVIFAYLYWGFSFLRMGAAGFTAQAIGRRKLTDCISLLARGLAVAFTVGILMIILQKPIADLFFWILKGSHSVESFARDYYHIRIWGAPAVMGVFVFSGWFIGMQNARSPVIVILSINLLNILLDVMFVKSFGWGVKGVALATVMAQYTGLAICFWILHKYYARLLPRLIWREVLNKFELLKFFNVNRDIFLRTLMLIGVFTFVESKPAELGDIELAVNAILVQLILMYSFVVDGFAYAAEALIGKYTGSGNQTLLKESLKKIFLLALFTGTLFSLGYYVYGQSIVGLFTTIPQVIDNARAYLYWVMAITLTGGIAFVWDGAFIGATASKEMLWSMAGATFLLFVPCYYLLESTMGLHALWLAFFLFFLGRGVFQTILARRALYK